MKHERRRRETWLDFASDGRGTPDAWLRRAEQDRNLAAQAANLGCEKVHELSAVLDLLSRTSDPARFQNDRVQL